MSLLWLLALEAAVGWSPPEQAAWSGDQPPIEVHLHAGTVSMRGTAPIDVDLIATGDGFAVSPFLQPTRGIAFEVTTDTGRSVASVEPMVGSPPPPPLGLDQLVPVTKTSPLHVVTKETARTVFPGPGRYRVKARLFFFSFPSEPVRYAQIVSDTITVDVTK